MVKNVFKKLGKKQKNNKGFSLVELIVVIAIMAVLVGVLAPQLIKYVEKSREATDIQNADSIATAVKAYFADKEGLGGNITVKISPSGNMTATPGGTVPTGATAAVGDDVLSALNDAGFPTATTNLKGTKWGTAGISIIYDIDNGKTSYSCDSDYYTTHSGTGTSAKTEAEQIKSKK